MYLGAPQLDGPVEGGGDEEVGEVDGPPGVVAVDARDGSVVALKHLADARLAARRWQQTHKNTQHRQRSAPAISHSH